MDETRQKVALLGGDHSTPLGYYEALTTIHDNFGILHLDAHMDLRIAYEGFTYSHASIMYIALQFPQITKIVQVVIRDFCEQEVQVAPGETDWDGNVVSRMLFHKCGVLAKKQWFERRAENKFS